MYRDSRGKLRRPDPRRSKIAKQAAKAAKRSWTPAKRSMAAKKAARTRASSRHSTGSRFRR